MRAEPSTRQVGPRHARDPRHLGLKGGKPGVGAHLGKDQAAFHLAEGAEPAEGDGAAEGRGVDDRISSIVLENRLVHVTEKRER
jgi:hypothetical protein